jgi:hypothetical protein
MTQPARARTPRLPHLKATAQREGSQGLSAEVTQAYLVPAIRLAHDRLACAMHIALVLHSPEPTLGLPPHF